MNSARNMGLILTAGVTLFPPSESCAGSVDRDQKASDKRR